MGGLESYEMSPDAFTLEHTGSEEPSYVAFTHPKADTPTVFETSPLKVKRDSGSTLLLVVAIAALWWMQEG